MRGKRAFLCALLLAVVLLCMSPVASAETAPKQEGGHDEVDLTPRLQEIYERRSQWLLTDGVAPPIDIDYQTESKTARWALHHEYGKFRYMKEWAKNRGVQFTEAKPSIKVKSLRRTSTRARYYVTQTLQLGYVYPNEQTVNRFGVGTRHIIELRREGTQWLIATEWYTDPLGDDTEIPDVMPALVPEPLPPGPQIHQPVAGATPRGYDREGAVKYADEFCGMAWGCSNDHKYNPNYRDYNGVGGDCTNFISQALKQGGKLSIPLISRVDTLASHLQHSGRATLLAREPFQAIWKRAREQSHGFEAMLKRGDLVAYQEKGKLEHFAMVTGFDTRGYPLVNSHSADRYHVPFDLGWDRKTVYWLFRMRD